LTGLHVIGLPRPDAWRVVQRVILDSMPQLRRKVMNLLASSTAGMDTTEVAEATGYPTVTARRTLEELAAYGVADRQSAGRGKADIWAISD
jgi:predicted ArsR family transcriptional regulator